MQNSHRMPPLKTENGEWRYWTPAAWIAWHEEHGLPVPVLDGDTGVWNLRHFDCRGYKWIPQTLAAVDAVHTVLNLPGQPRPRDDYRP